MEMYDIYSRNFLAKSLRPHWQHWHGKKYSQQMAAGEDLSVGRVDVLLGQKAGEFYL